MAADPAVSDPPPPGLIARAAAQGNAAAVALLLERGADVNAFGERATALHEAAWRNDTELVEALLQRRRRPHAARPPVRRRRPRAGPTPCRPPPSSPSGSTPR